MPDPSFARPLGLWLMALAGLVLVALLAWWLRGSTGGAVAPGVRGVGAAETGPTGEPHSPDVQPPESVGRDAVQTAADAPEEPQDAADAPDGEPAEEEPDLELRDWLELRVVDGLGAPVADAQVTIGGLRKEGEEGSWFSMRGDDSVARSGRDGRVRVDYTRWVDIDGKAVGVDLTVTHPGFIPFNDSSFRLAPGVNEVVLAQGPTLWLGAWHGAARRVVPEIEIEVEWEAHLGPDAWQREPDGRWSTTLLAPGPHFVSVTHQSAELGRLASDFTSFELPESGTLELELELRPLVVLRGRLDDAVPRPIVNGHVWVNLHTSPQSIGLCSDHEAAVAADGTFELPGLRAARGQAIALCDGWVTRLVQPSSLEETSAQVPANAPAEVRDEVLARARAEERVAQPVDAAAGEPLVLAMERTGVLEVRVVDEDGAPLEGATVSASPNVRWAGVGSRIFPWREWRAITDAGGLARIPDLPPDESLWFGAGSSTHRLRKQDRDTTPSARIQSGETTHAELVLERK